MDSPSGGGRCSGGGRFLWDKQGRVVPAVRTDVKCEGMGVDVAKKESPELMEETRSCDFFTWGPAESHLRLTESGAHFYS